MEPRYSILFYGEDLEKYKEKIRSWLYSGIKVLWFGKEEEVKYLQQEYPGFTKAFLLQVYIVNCHIKQILVDGINNDQLMLSLKKKCPQFNVAQYQVEHCKEYENIVVQASAGTGKTKVMVDRIMFLIHMVPDLKLSEIYMITFTNEAADEMERRLQNTLMTRFRLTGQMKYFKWVEEQSQMKISTIHSFAYDMLKEYGIGQSFTQNLSIQSLKQERKELIRDILDNHMDTSKSIQSQIGIPLYKAASVIDKYWNGFTSIGISRKDIQEMDWGKTFSKESEKFQNLMAHIIGELDDAYFEIKRKNDAIAVNDIMRDLQEIITEEVLPMPDLSMKYLFIDEFQDSDLSQIKVAVFLIKLLHGNLFVVGDVKQSIYSFRGATDQAFDILDRDLKEAEIKPAKKFILINNYRTAANIMKQMDRYFEKWGDWGLLKYDGPVIPFNGQIGTIEMIQGSVKQELEDLIIGNEAAKYLDNLIEDVERSEELPNEKKRVVMLTRTNSELVRLATILKKRGIPFFVDCEGTFFTCEAVRDFYTMICSYIFADEPKYIFNYLLTPYAGNIQSMNVNEMEQLDGNKDMLIEYLGRFLSQTSWEKYYKEFRLRPVMSVIKNILDETAVVEHFIACAKQRRQSVGWDERKSSALTKIEAIQYQADLEKLLELLRVNLNGEKVSLYDVYHYLQIQIATNRTETQPHVGNKDGYSSILCMTVHKSKGLEFDTVILPFTHRHFPDKYDTEILIDPLRRMVGWNYKIDGTQQDMKNSLYDELKEKAIEKIRAEETRILYVAMTRAINKLICIIHPPKDTERWSYLLKEADIDEK